MAMNAGVRKYKEVAKKTSPTKETKSSSALKAKVAETKTEEKKREKSKKELETAAKEVKTKTVTPAVNAPASADAPPATAAVTQEASDQALQQELETEIAKDAPHTAGLVKDDISPVNCHRDKLIPEYAPLIKYIAQKIAARLPANIELDDLMSSGVIGLMDAIEKYDPSRDNKFKTYAEFRIRGAILDELRAQDWVPRSVREKAKQLERVFARIEQDKGRQATDEEVCAELGISQEEYHDMLNQVRSVSLVSYDDITNFSKADKRSLHGYGESTSKTPTPFSEINSAHLKKLIADAIRDLPEKQRLVLSLYYYEDLNLKEIGRVLDVTESRVSQLHTQAVLRLKARLKNHWDEFVSLVSL